MRATSVTVRLLAIAAAAFCLPHSALAAGGPFGIDHKLHYDDSGIWKRRNQNIVYYGTIVSAGAGALWLGDDDELGDTLWRSVDSMVVTAVGTQALKWTFQRERPSQTDSPNQWFKGWHAQSFPSGEVAAITAAVTPIMAHYGGEHPAIYALALLPAYDAVARVKTHGHWQSDVLVGAAIGVGVGLWAEHRKSPWIVSFLPHGVQVGFSKHWD
ncbi:phosphatase PAP2 family protein [Dyella sp. BiH032]|uniref:phosphatase PAP2 family protein n=1 Tax=Dyella sp. BiH032 TaxID=3075430 RepID=UPI0028933061|nr:phosphatase PAP2 family protein [Dyella sp. BiH032]WNL44565.1 phosphatase PAP2 family protein [Dyella sp. BiH032]